MHQMLQNVGKSIEVQEQERKDYEAKIKAFEAETKRISAVQAGMTFEQIQDIVQGTIAGMITSGDLISEMPGQEMPIEEMPMEGMEQEMPMEEMPMEGFQQ
jgi:hypothetical protein